jgi:hypothetical protein
MASTYSPNLRIELIGTGDQAGTWGSTTNTNLGTLMENAISGYVSVSVISANQAFTALNGAADQSRNAVIELTTTTGADFAVYAPPSPKTYVIINSSAYAASVYNSTALANTIAAGTGVAVPAGKTVTIWSDGDNMAVQIDHLPTLSLTSDLAVIDGGTGASTATGARTNLGVTATGADTTYAFRANNLSDLASATSSRTNLGVAIGSDVQAYDADLTVLGGLAKTDGNFIVGNGSTWVAESGATARTSLGLGSIATQNSNTVSITGGSVTGITDITVADGGTGASDAGTARTNLGLVIGTNVPSPTGTGASGTWEINITGNAGTATTAVGLAAATWTVSEVGGVLYFKVSGVNKAKLDASGNFTVVGNVTAYGSV